LNSYAHHQQIISEKNDSSSNNNSSNSTDEVTVMSKFGTYIYPNADDLQKDGKHSKKLICYYTTPRFTTSSSSRRKNLKSEQTLSIKDINPQLCTHLNIGIIEIFNCSLVIDADLVKAFEDGNRLRAQNKNLKIMLWVGGADESDGFTEMILNHANRKRFIQSLKDALEKHVMDGVS